MKVKELIELLKDMPQDLEVYSYCDHGQTPERTGSPRVAHTDELEYFLWDDWATDPHDVKENCYRKAFVLL